MLYFNLVANKYLVSVTEGERDPNAGLYISRHDFNTLADAETMAARANELGDGNTYIATDAGPGVWPRFDVVRMFKVGERVSYGFNGDMYPDGEIAAIGTGPRMAIKTTGGGTYFRKGKSGSWVKMGGGASLAHGWHEKRNEER